MRVRHLHEPTPAMTIANKGDCWEAYCHRCHKGGRVSKTHVVLSAVPDQQRFMPWPQDAKLLSLWAPWIQEPLYGFLLSKGVDIGTMLSDVPLYYSQSQRRLLFGTKVGWLGRATAGQLPKWTGYGYPAPAYGAHHLDPVQSTVVLTEDLLSAFKCRWALKESHPNVSSQALLGTVLRDAHLAALIAAGVGTLVLFLDGDTAGDDGIRAVRRRGQGLGLRVVVAQCPRDKDPKDLTKQQIINLVGGALGGSNFTSPTQPG